MLSQGCSIRQDPTAGPESARLIIESQTTNWTIFVPGPCVTLAVSNNGMGIDAESQCRRPRRAHGPTLVKYLTHA